MTASAPREKTVLYVDGRNDKTNILLISNPDSRQNPVLLQLHVDGETHLLRTTVPGNGKLEA